MRYLLVCLVFAAQAAFGQLGVGGSGTSYIPSLVRTVVAESSDSLTNGSSFDSGYINVSIFSSVGFRVFASHNGSYTIYFSADGVTAHSTIGPYIYDKNTIYTPNFFGLEADFARIVFTNNSGFDQTDFYMQISGSGSDRTVKIGRNRKLPFTVDTVPVRMADELDVMRGRVEGEYIIPKYGANTDVDAAEDIWNGGGDYTGFPTSSAESFEVFSSDANDTNASGSGARVLRVFYYDDDYVMFDSNGDYLYFDVELNGVTGVIQGTTGMRIWRAVVISSGSGQTNAGDITIRWSTTTSAIFAVIAAGIGQTQVTSFTIPDGYTGYLKRFSSSMNDNTANSANMALKVRTFDTNTFRLTRPFVVKTTDQVNRPLYGGEKLDEKTDLVFRCTDIANANGIITVSYAIHLVKN